MENWKETLRANFHVFSNPNKKIWQPAELKLAYDLKNAADGTKLVDTGCSACRRSVISRVKYLAEHLDDPNI